MIKLVKKPDDKKDTPSKGITLVPKQSLEELSSGIVDYSEKFSRNANMERDFAGAKNFRDSNDKESNKFLSQLSLYQNMYGDEETSSVLKGMEDYVRGTRKDLGEYQDSFDIAVKKYNNDLDIQLAGIDDEIKAKRNEITSSKYEGAKARRARDKSYTSDYQDLENELKALEEKKSELQNEKNYRTYQSYMSSSKMPDFDEKSGYVSTQQKDVTPNLLTGQYADDIYGDINYELVNKNPQAKDVYTTNASARGDYLFNGDSNLTELTDEETKVYNYLYATDKNKANEFLTFMNSDLDARQRERITKEYEAMASENPVLASAWSVLSSPMKSVSALGQALDFAINREVNENAAYNRFSYENTAIRNKVSQDIMEKHVDDSGLTNFWGKAGSFLYQTGMSMGDFLFNAAITGAFGNGISMSPDVAENMSLAIMGSGAGADATIAAKDRGLSDSQAFAIGTVAGLAEVVTEKVSLDTLLDAAARGKGALAYILSNTVAEGSEEVASDLINWTADILIAQDKSEWEESIRQYMINGATSRKEAFNKALKDKLLEMGASFLGGALSGAAMSASGVALNNIVTAYDIQRNGEQVQLIESMPSERPNSIASTTDMQPGNIEKKTSANERLERAALGDDVNAGYQNLMNSLGTTPQVESSDFVPMSIEYKRSSREYKAVDKEIGKLAKKLKAGEEVTASEINAVLDLPAANDYFSFGANENPSYKRAVAVDVVYSSAYGTTPSMTSQEALASPNDAVSSAQGQIYQSGNNNAEIGRKSPDIEYVENSASNLGENGKGAFVSGFRGENAGDYVEKAQSYYFRGLNDLELNYEINDTIDLDTASELYKAGISDEDSRIESEGIEYESTGNGEERSSYLDRGRRTSKVQRRLESSIRQQGRKAESRRIAVASQEKVSLKDAGVSTGTDEKNIVELNYRNYDKEMVRISKLYKKHGVKVHFIIGEMHVQDGEITRRVRGVHEPGEVWIRADHDRLTVSQIGLHELFHELEDRSNNTLVEKMREKIIEHYSEAELNDLVMAYAQAYEWSDRTNEQILSEIFADAYAGIDVFDYLSIEGATRFSQASVQEWAKEVEYDTNQMNAPPKELEKQGVAIKYEVAGAKYSEETDNNGRQLSVGQVEYFKDSVARDNNGNLLTMYHGTNKAGFTVFRGWQYFTANKQYAQRYSRGTEGLYEVYTNITKPFDTRIPECRDIFENEFYGNYSRTGLMESGLPDWTDGYDLVDFLEENGYDFDAIYLDEGGDPTDNGVSKRGISYVVRSSEQVKNVNNLNPTTNPDIRYSEETDKEYLELAKDAEKNKPKLQEMVQRAAEKSMPQSRLRDENGQLRIVYHGTNSGDFNVFDPSWIGSASGDAGFFGMGFYFAYTKGEASYYGARRIIPAYLDIKNPFNFEKEMRSYNGVVAPGSQASEGVAFINLAEKFPEIAAKETITVGTESDELKDISLAEFAKAYKDIVDNKKFRTQQIKNQYGDTETLVFADEKTRTYTDADGKKHSYVDHGYETRFYGKFNQLEAAWDYLEKNVYSGYIDYLSLTNVILNNSTEFTDALKRMGYDGTIQSEYGDEAVAFESSQVKSAEPITYDDNGNVIPLSERFNVANPDIRYSEEGRGNGYDGYSMSNNARAAYANGEMPLSKWSKTEILSAINDINPDIDCSKINLETLKSKFLKRTSWHHTSKAFNRTDFYSIHEAYVKSMSQEKVDEIAAKQKPVEKAKRNKSADEFVDDAYAKVLAIIEAGILKTETGAIKRLADPAAFEESYSKAVEIIKSRDSKKIEQWRKFPADHYRHKDVNLYDNNIDEYIREMYADKKLSKNSNVFKSIARYAPSVEYSEDLPVNSLAKNTNQLKEETKKLQTLLKSKDKEIAALRRELTVNAKPTVKRSDVEKLAKEQLRSMNSSSKATEVTKMMEALGNKIVQGKEYTYEELFDDAIDISEYIIQGCAELKNSDDMERLKAIKDYFKGHEFYFDNYDRYNAVTPEYLKDQRRAKGHIQDYKTFKFKNLRRFKLTADSNATRIDGIWEELQNEFGYDYFPDITSYPEMVQHISDLLDGTNEVWEIPADLNSAEVIEGNAQEILNGLLSDAVRQNAPSYADAMNLKLSKQRYKYEEKLREVRAKRDEQIQALKDKAKNKALNQRETASKNKIKNHIEKSAKDLRTLLLSPNDKKHVPESLRGSVARLLEIVNLESTMSYDMDGKLVRNRDGAPTKRTRAFMELKEELKKVAGDLVIDPNFFGDEFSQGDIDEVISYGDIPIRAMTLEQLETLSRVVDAVYASVRSYNKLFSEMRFKEIGEAADALMEDNGRKTAPTQYKGAAGKFLELVKLDMLTPEAYFHRLGKSGDNLFRAFRNAQDKYVNIVKDTKDFTTKNLKGYDIKTAENAVHDVVLGGRKAKLTTAQIMEIYNLYMRGDQAINHMLYGGGIQPSDIETKGLKKTVASEPYKGITIEEIQDVIRLLSADEIRIADALREFVSTTMSDYGNEASMNVYNYKKFNEDNYWPIRVSKQETKTTIESESQQSALKNKGFTKAVTPNAKNAIMVGSAFDTFTKHVADMSTYSAYLEVSEDLQRILNYQFEDKRTVKGILDTVFGRGGKEYYTKLLTDVAMGIKGEKSYMGGLTGNYKAAAVGANLRVMLQQPTAIARALDMIDPKYLVEGMKPNEGWKKAVKYAPIATWKDWGFFDINTGRQMKDILFENSDKLEKAKQAAMWGAGKMDSLGWGQLWNACELETKDKYPDLKGEALYKKTAERFTEIVDRTQVVDGILQRSQIMRSADGLTKMATSFMGEPTKQYNMLLTAAYDAKTYGTKEAKSRLARTVTSLIVSGVLNAVAQSIVDGLRDDDEEKTYWEKWLTAFTGITGDEETFGQKVWSVAQGNLVEGFNPLGFIPFVKDVWSMIKGMDVERMDMESVSDVITKGSYFLKSLNGTGKTTIGMATVDMFNATAKFFGLPLANVKRDVMGIAGTIINETDNPLLRYEFTKLSKKVGYSSNNKSYFTILYDAYKSENEDYQALLNRMMKDGFDEEKLTTFVNDKLKEESGVTNVRELGASRYAATNNETYGKMTSALEKSSNWKKVDEDSQEKIINMAYQIATGTTTGKKYQDKYAGSTVDDTEFLLFQLALEAYDEDKNGNSTIAETEKALKSIYGNGKNKEAALLFNIEKPTAKNNPFK